MAVHSHFFGYGNLFLTSNTNADPLPRVLAGVDDPDSSYRTIEFCVNQRKWNALVTVKKDILVRDPAPQDCCPVGRVPVLPGTPSRVRTL